MDHMKVVRLTRIVPNPSYNRRYQIGLEAVKEFVDGEPFTVRTPSQPAYTGEVIVSRVADKDRPRRLPRDVADLIIASSTEARPDTLRELLAYADVIDYRNSGFEVLKKAYKQGLLTAEQIIAFARGRVDTTEFNKLAKTEVPAWHSPQQRSVGAVSTKREGTPTRR